MTFFLLLVPQQNVVERPQDSKTARQLRRSHYRTFPTFVTFLPAFIFPFSSLSSFSPRFPAFFYILTVMSIWDTLSGRKPKTTQTETTYDSRPAPDANSLLSDIAIPDPSQLHPLAGLNQDTLEYLKLEDAVLTDLPGGQTALPSRGWADDLSYGTGTTYLAALGTGGLWGMVEGMKKVPPGAPPKLRLNGVLNAVTRRGPFLGNSAGVIAMVYNGLNSTLGYARGKHDAANSVLAGALSGMLFKSTRGVRPMLVSGGVVASVAAVWTV
jgi:import inner membrane translocase subunit TIM23